MPHTEVMEKFGKGKLHSGSKKGPKVTSRQQAIAIMMSEKRAATGGKKEYQSNKKKSKVDTGPSDNVRKKHNV